MKWLSLVSLTLLSSLHAWGPRFSWASQIEPSVRPVPEIRDFPLAETQEWFIKPSYLIMIPNVDNTDYGNLVDAPNDAQSSIKIKRPDFEWGSGVRVGIGRYLPKHDHWDISLTTTYLYNSTQDKSQVKTNPTPLDIFDQNPVINLGWTPAVNSEALQVHSSWRLNYFIWDLLVRRQYVLSSQVTFEPFIGIRLPLIYQKYRLGTESIFNDELSSFSKPFSFTARDRFWGGGPKLGYDLSYKFGGYWMFMGQMAMSLIYSNQTIQESGNGIYDASVSTTPTQVKFSQSITALRTNLEASLGIGFEKWVRQNKVRIAPSFVFEVTDWFDLMHWSYNPALSTSFPESASKFMPAERTGDFGLMGFALNLQIDF